MMNTPNPALLDEGVFNIRTVKKVFRELPVEMLRPGIFQTRKTFNKSSLAELATSMKATGTNSNALIVRPIKYSDGYEIICGERRWRAAQKNGFSTLLCCIGDFNDQQAMYVCGADNIQREDFNPIEEALSYELMISAGLTHQELANNLGKSRAHITNYLRLLKLPFSVRDLIIQEKLSYGQARPICALDKASVQKKLATDAVAGKWSSARVNQEVSKLLSVRKPLQRRSTDTQDVNVERLRELVSEQTGYPCVIRKSERGTWQFALSAASVEEFQGILERFGINTDQL